MAAGVASISSRVAYFRGAAQVAAGLGVLFSVMPALAVTLEASALSSFTVVVRGRKYSARTPAIYRGRL